MDITKIEPQFGETDLLRHIHYASVMNWFEHARTKLYGIFCPDYNPDNWCLVMAHAECDYFQENLLGFTVEIHTRVERVGNSSVTLVQECRQRGVLTAKGKCVLVHIDPKTKRPRPLTPELKAALERY